MAREILKSARELASKCSIPTPLSIGDIGTDFISLLHEKICQPYLVDPPLLPSRSLQPQQHLKSIVDSLACNFLNLDLDRVLRVEDILRGDEDALALLLFIFDNLYECLVRPSQQKGVSAMTAHNQRPVSSSSNSKRRILGPTFMGKRINDLRSVSVLHSPRTAALRRMKRSKSAHEAIIQAKKSRTLSAMAKFPSHPQKIDDQTQAMSKYSSTKNIQEHSHRLHLANEKRRAHLALEKAKASVRNQSADHGHITSLLKRTISDLRLRNVSNRIKLEIAKENATLDFENRDAVGSSSCVSRVDLSSIRDQAKDKKEIRQILHDLASKGL